MKTFFDNVKPVIGILTILLVFGYLFGITFTEVKLPHDIVPQVLIAIVAFGKDIYSYFFGNSQGSAKKDEIISNLNSLPVATTTSGDVNVDATTKEVKS